MGFQRDLALQSGVGDGAEDLARRSRAEHVRVQQVAPARELSSIGILRRGR